jgi:hypothetical protein
MIDFAMFFNKITEVYHRFWGIYMRMLQFSATLGHQIFQLIVHPHLVRDDYLTLAAVTFENAPA